MRLYTFMFYLIPSLSFHRFFLFWLLFFHFYSSVAGAFEMLSIKVGSVAYWVGYFGWCASKLSKIGSSLEAERLQKSSPSSLLMPSWPRGFYLLMSCRLSARLLEQMSHRFRMRSAQTPRLGSSSWMLVLVLVGPVSRSTFWIWFTSASVMAFLKWQNARNRSSKWMIIIEIVLSAVWFPLRLTQS